MTRRAAPHVEEIAAYTVFGETPDEFASVSTYLVSMLAKISNQ